MTDVLPAHLRTDHWYCDLHHAMLVIMFKRLIPALRSGNRQQSTYFVDNMTVYWLLHCLMEEEGFAHAVARGRVDQTLIDAHASAHLKLMMNWRDDVFLPFKEGNAAAETLADAADAYYKAVVHHIETFDQQTYGTESGHDARSRSAEISHIAESGLPLTPFMDGAMDTTRRLMPKMAIALAPRASKDAATPPTMLQGGAMTGMRADLARALGTRKTALTTLGREFLAA